MATWTSIPDANLDPDKPARSIDALALRDNPVAIAEGATGAPKVDPIAAMAHGGAAGAVGTFAWAIPTTVITYAFGDTISGADLSPAGIQTDSAGPDNVSVLSSGVLTGTWRCMGYAPYSAVSLESATLWLRIS